MSDDATDEPGIEQADVAAGEVLCQWWEPNGMASSIQHRYVIAPAGDEWMVVHQTRRKRASAWSTDGVVDARDKPEVLPHA